MRIPWIATFTVLTLISAALVVGARWASADDVTVPTHALTAPSSVSGLSAARQSEIAHGCGRSWNGNSSATGTVYNFVGLPAYGWALIYAPGYSVTCELNGEGGPFNAGGGGLTSADVAQVTVPYQVDHDGGGIREDDARPGGYRVIAGRVSPGVDSVRITLTNRVASMRTSNGTFLVCFNYADGDWLDGGPPRIEAFAGGRPVAPPDGRTVRWR